MKSLIIFTRTTTTTTTTTTASTSTSTTTTTTTTRTPPPPPTTTTATATATPTTTAPTTTTFMMLACVRKTIFSFGYLGVSSGQGLAFKIKRRPNHTLAFLFNTVSSFDFYKILILRMYISAHR